MPGSVLHPKRKMKIYVMVDRTYNAAKRKELMVCGTVSERNHRKYIVEFDDEKI